MWALIIVKPTGIVVFITRLLNAELLPAAFTVHQSVEIYIHASQYNASYVLCVHMEKKREQGKHLSVQGCESPGLS